jgi:uncharacterized protein with HEPN domain
MKHPDRVPEYVRHMIEAIQRAIRYAVNVGSLSALEHNEQAQDAIVRTLAVIGEAANRIQKQAPEFVAAHPELPWRPMCDIRNKVIHDYFDVAWDIVWDTVHNDLPPLQAQLESLLRA